MKPKWYKNVDGEWVKITQREANKIIMTFGLTGKRIIGSDMSIWYKDDENQPIILLCGNGH